MDQNLQTILGFGNTSSYSLDTDFAFQLFIAGLENKSIFLDQYLQDFNRIGERKDKEYSFSKLKNNFVRKRRKRKKRSKKQCKFFLANLL